MRTVVALLALSTLSWAGEPDPGTVLSDSLQSCAGVKFAKMRGRFSFFSLDGKTKRNFEFEGETGKFELTHFKVSTGKLQGTEVWSHGGSRAVSEDGKTWFDGTTGTAGETWQQYVSPEEVISIVTHNAQAVQLSGRASVGGVGCYLVKVTLSPGGVAQVLSRAASKTGSLDAKTVEVAVQGSVGEKDGLLYGLEVTLTASGTLAPGAQDPKPPENLENMGPVGQGTQSETKGHEAERGHTMWSVSFEFTNPTDKKELIAPAAARKWLGF